MDSSLDNILRTNTLNHQCLCFIFFQLLSAVAFLNSAGIVHQDIRPENILINADCSLKLCDFGFAKQNKNKNSDQANYFLGYYSAPEEVLNSEILGEKIDIWSLGCLFAEMVIKTPLFEATTSKEYIKLILGAVGYQNEDELSFIKQKKYKDFVNENNIFSNTIGEHLKSKWALSANKKQFDCRDNELIDLLSNMLILNPEKRYSLIETLSHPYFEKYRKMQLPIFNSHTQHFPFPNSNATDEDIFNEFLNEAKTFHTGIINI